MLIERMFDSHSFQEEITNDAEANAAVLYLAGNETAFRRELQNEGLSHDEVENTVAEVWKNLLQSCKRVGFSNYITDAKTAQFNK